MACCNPALPASVTAGLTFQAVLSLPDYPAPDWSVSAILRGPQSIDLDATPQGTDHVLNVAAATTTGWAAGVYWYSLRATNGSQVLEAESGRIEILADLAAVSGTFDGRTEAERALAAIDAVLSKRATQDQQRYTINNRELWRTPIADLIKLRAFYAARVRRERRKGCSPFGRAIPVRFTE
ncbi:MAG: hypothetical protein ACTHKN_01095 [Achromobacter mucicolens]